MRVALPQTANSSPSVCGRDAIDVDDAGRLVRPQRVVAAAPRHADAAAGR